MEIPSNKPGGDAALFLYNVVNSKLAVMQYVPIGGVDELILQIYKDIDFYQAHQQQNSLRCRKA